MADASRVVIDANIAIAASIRLDLVSAGAVRHRVHDEASALVDRLAKCGNGYVVPAVRSEATGALPKAVAYTMSQVRTGMYAAQVRREHYTAVLRSRKRLGGIFRSMNAVRPDPEQVARSMGMVIHMSESLMDRYKALTGRRYAARGRPAGAPGGEGGAQLPTEALQLGRFAKKHPNRGDQRVLAEAAAFRDSLPAGSRVVIASSDTGFFSPYRHSDGVSDTVTAEICRRFGIRCDHPEVILREECGAE